MNTSSADERSVVSGQMSVVPSLLLVGAARIMGEPFDLYRAADRRRSRAIWFFVSTSWSAGTPTRRFVARSRQKRALRSKLPYDIAAMMLIFTAFIVGVFYCLDALHGERRDRSILFWKSLPVSDLTTLLSKATIPLIVLPLVTFAIIVATQVVMLLWTSVLPHDSRHESHIDLDEFPVISAISDPALRIGRDCALACADLRLGAVGLRLGAARNFSLGGDAISRNRCFREDHVRHFAFCLDAKEPLNGIRAEGFRLQRGTRSTSRTTHADEIPQYAGSLAWINIRRSICRRRDPAAPLSRTNLIHLFSSITKSQSS